MKVETKYDIGDAVFFPNNGSVLWGKIVTIDIVSRKTKEKGLKDKQEIVYGIECTDLIITNPVRRNEEGLFTCREDVVKLLADTQIRGIKTTVRDLDVLLMLKDRLNGLITAHPEYYASKL